MKLAIYAHWNDTDRVIGFAWPYLRSLRAAGYEIILVSNSPLHADEVARLRAIVGKVIVRENTGLDFFMWRAALLDLDLSAVDELLLTNSSIVGPVAPLEGVFEKARAWDCDFWGLTESFEGAQHVQSFFFVFRRPVLASPAFMEFWQNLLPFSFKHQLIRAYELGLTAWLVQHGFRFRVVASREAVWQRHRERLKARSLTERLSARLRTIRQQPSLVGKAGKIVRDRPVLTDNLPLFYPEILIELGVPFVKAELLRATILDWTPAHTHALLAKHGFELEAGRTHGI